MTAPRKPVAWTARAELDDIAKGHAATMFPNNVLHEIPLYTAPDLQPLWALVGQWHDQAAELDELGDYDGSTIANHHANELRATLEAMQ